ncbi:hypothetical protein BU24DRAFT_274309 [Aaosphaeria arxii CBS 175.79]|uniref:Uncharacterized protein n=1 Tax=Aaosphaeria arxii CBS 175.79 TaxID=1450172 RepID=A0A6A5XGD8_9PLEO|nr:uncharacterized protein BU24DRAFT_274309 [Aaosphaeria arxii CBS 175.79]KAF2012295.1 hypothetical protein BU24DRAFT_274309 [Aaosphaeria arxii CBS 175.79]
MYIPHTRSNPVPLPPLPVRPTTSPTTYTETLTDALEFLITVYLLWAAGYLVYLAGCLVCLIWEMGAAGGSRGRMGVRRGVDLTVFPTLQEKFGKMGKYEDEYNGGGYKGKRPRRTTC